LRKINVKLNLEEKCNNDKVMQNILFSLGMVSAVWKPGTDKSKPSSLQTEILIILLSKSSFTPLLNFAADHKEQAYKFSLSLL
jgi:hypothetical protein